MRAQVSSKGAGRVDKVAAALGALSMDSSPCSIAIGLGPHQQPETFLEQAQPGGGNRWSPSSQVCQTCKTALGSLKTRGEWGKEVHSVTTLVT